MSEEVVIRVENLWKRYGLPIPELAYKAGSWARSKRSGEEVGSKSPWALRDINLEVQRGETLGIIGRNGAGKSTLLKLLAGVSPPTRGKVSIQGQVFPMIELNAGLNWELTGRENVRLLGAIMGLTSAEISAKMPAIEMFTELDEWFDKPVRKYSSGMLARLGFGVAMNVDAEILLVDEILAVGDVGFQNRCLQKMKEQRDQGKTILFVSHSLDMVQYICKRVVLLDRGGMIAMGEPEQIITTYENSQYYRESEYVDKSSGFSTAINTQRFQLIATEISDSLGRKNKSFEPEEGLLVDFKCETNLQLKDLIFTFALLNQRREACIWEYIEGEKIDAGYVKSPFHLRVHVPSIPLSGGLYLVGFMVRDRRSLEKLCHHKAAGRFTVEASARERGMLTVPLSWECLNDQ